MIGANIIINIPHQNKVINLDNENITKLVEHAKSKLGQNSRVLLRYSGTEPVIRLMIEGENETMVTNTAKEIIATIENLLKD